MSGAARRVRRAGPRRRRRLAAPLGHAPVQHQHLAEGPDHDVLGLEVAVHDALGVGEGHRFARPLEQAQPPGQRSVRARVLVQALPANQAHHVEDAAVRQGAHVVDGHQPRVLEARQDPRLLHHPPDVGRLRHRRVQDLEGHLAVQLVVACPVDGAHPAAPQHVDHLVLGAGQIGGVRHRPQVVDHRVGQHGRSHGGSTPSRSRASARNSSSLPQAARRTSSTCRRSERRMAARWLVTCVTGRPSSAPRLE